MEPIRFWIPIEKIDAEKRLVYGYASTPALDLQGERVSLEAIKRALPDYMQWRNIREMHQMSAVGVAESAEVDKKGLYIVGRIVDDEAWRKVKEGVYKGFSIGGQRLSKVGDEITELILTEISLVDRPANPECRIELFKRAPAPDGEGVTLKPAEVGLLARIIGKLAGFASQGKASSGLTGAALSDEASLNARPVGPNPQDDERAGNEGGMTWSPYDASYAHLDELLHHCEGADFERIGACGGDDDEADLELESQLEELADGDLDGASAGSGDGDDDEDGDGEEHTVFGRTVAPRDDVSEADKARAERRYGDVEFADPRNKKYPLDTPRHIRAAWRYFAMPKNRRFYTPEEQREIERRIIRAWKRKIDPAGPPAARARKRAAGDALRRTPAGSPNDCTSAPHGLGASFSDGSKLNEQTTQGEISMGVFDGDLSKRASALKRASLHRANSHFSKAAEHQHKAAEHHGHLIRAHKGAHQALSALSKVLKAHHDAEKAGAADKGAADSALMADMARNEFPHDEVAAHLARATEHLSKAAEHAAIEGRHASRAIAHQEAGMHHLAKAMAVWVGEKGEAPGDPYPGLYEVPPGVHPMAQDELTEGDVPDYDLKYPYALGDETEDIPPYSTPPASVERAAMGGGVVSAREAALMRKAAYLEGKLEALASTPAKPRAQLFAVSKQMLGADASYNRERVAELLEGVSENDDPLRASARILGNMVLKGIGARSTFDPAFRGAAGGSRFGTLPTRM